MTSPTAINDIGDLLRILEERPEWTERLRAILLTREVLELPERVTQLTARVDRLAQAQEETNARLDRLAQAQEETNARLDRFIQSQDEFNRAQQETNARVDRRLENLETQVGGLETQVGGLNTRVGGLETQVGILRTQVDGLLGSDLENSLHGNIASIAARNFNLRRVHILKSRLFPPDQNFYNRLYAAEDAGHITPEQSHQLLAVDFILSAQETESQESIYLAVEVSRTVAAYDITRARERADALRAATGVKSLAVVIGSFIPEPEQARANEQNVTLIQEPPL